jgi:DNA polymerase III subunit epsilon
MRPLLCFDIEATGPNPATDKIVSIAFKTESDQERSFLVNPDRPIPKEATEVHGITDEMVAEKPRFGAFAHEIHSIVKDCDLLGFNLSNFDVPLLWEELYRCEIEWDLSETHILDAGTLMKRREERTLSAALQFYCGREHTEAHNAMGDVVATWDVWKAQVQRYKLHDLDRFNLERESNYEEQRVDLAGKIVVGKDFRPTYNFGKSKGVAVLDDIGYAMWMLRADFTQNTKMHLESILNQSAAVCAGD